MLCAHATVPEASRTEISESVGLGHPLPDRIGTMSSGRCNETEKAGLIVEDWKSH
jgi:hypothetical protein